MTLQEAIELLGVERSASPDEVRKAWLRAVRKYRPERDPEGFKRVTEAYELLEKARSWATIDLEPPDRPSEDGDLRPTSSNNVPKPPDRNAWDWVAGSFGQGIHEPPPPAVLARILQARQARSYSAAADLVLEVMEPGRVPIGREVLLSIAAGCVAEGNIELGRSILGLVEQSKGPGVETTDRGVPHAVVWDLFDEAERAPPALAAAFGKAVAEGDPLIAVPELHQARISDEVPAPYVPLASTPALARFMKDYTPPRPAPWGPDLFPSFRHFPILVAAIVAVVLLMVQTVDVDEAPTPDFPAHSFLIAAIQREHPAAADLVRARCAELPDLCPEWVTWGVQASFLDCDRPTRPEHENAEITKFLDQICAEERGAGPPVIDRTAPTEP